MESGIEETSIVERKDKWKKGKTREEKEKMRKRRSYKKLRGEITSQVERKKSNDSNVEKSHKSAHASPML